MFEALAGMFMAMKVNFCQMKYHMFKRQDRVVAETIYLNEVDKVDEKEKYEKSRLPESGYMTVAEYEEKSRGKSKKEISAKILDKAEMPEDKNMVYIPQKKFKLVKYNVPVGSPELKIQRKLNFDRQINAQGIISGDYTKLVYPAVYYYAQSDCTSCDLFLINLDSSLSNIEKVKKANIVNKEPDPLISTSKDIDTKFIFRTLTPIDFSSDNTKLVVKEKVGHRHDGIWKTDLWVYDFEKKEARKLPQIREAIVNYWALSGGVDFDEKRWDIYPMGFDANDENRVILCAYAYTGDIPKFLGTWSIDIYGENSRLESLTGSSFPVSTVGYRLEQEADVMPVSEVEFEARQAKELEKAKEKEAKDAENFEKQVKRLEYQRKIQQMDMDTMIKIRERKQYIKDSYKKSSDGLTGD